MTTGSEMTGGCDCGELRYRMTSAPLIVHCCHCRWCQRETGTAFALNAMIESERVELLKGEPILIDTPSESGKGQLIARCPSCHIAIWSHYALGTSLRFVRVGSLDDPDRLPPDVHIYTASKQPWVQLPGDAKVFAGYYDRRDVWPTESLDRLTALKTARQGETKPTAS